MQACDHWLADPPWLHFKPPLWASTAFQGSILSLHSSWILNLMRFRIHLLTWMRILVLLFTRMRILNIDTTPSSFNFFWARIFKCFWGPGIDSSLCSLAGRYDNPIPPRFLAPIDFLKIPALNAQTGGAVCKGATPSVEQPGGRGFKPRLRSLLD